MSETPKTPKTASTFDTYVSPLERKTGSKFSLIVGNPGEWFKDNILPKIAIRNIKWPILAAVSVVAGLTLNGISNQINRDASIRIGSQVIERKGDVGPGIVKGLMETLGMSGQSTNEEQQFISNLNLSPDDIEARVKSIYDRNVDKGVNMEDLNGLMDLARNFPDKPIGLQAIADLKQLVRLDRVVQFRRFGSKMFAMGVENTYSEGLELQRKMKVQKIDYGIYYKDGDFEWIERIDEGNCTWVMWLTRAVHPGAG